MTYSGNKIFNSNNLVPLIIILIFGGIAIASDNIDGINGYWIFIVIGYLITVKDAFYFEIADNEFIVKNYLLPFMKIHYNLSEITEIQLLSATYRSTADAQLKVIRGEQRSFGFHGASLGIKDWQEMVNDLCSKKIMVVVTANGLEDKIGIPE